MEKLRPLNLVFGSSGSTQLRLVVSVSVADAVRDGHWNLPPERSENAETLQVVFSTTSAPLTTNDNDSYLWRSQSVGFCYVFPSSVTLNMMRQRLHVIVWYEVFWFSGKILRCFFVT